MVWWQGFTLYVQPVAVTVLELVKLNHLLVGTGYRVRMVDLHTVGLWVDECDTGQRAGSQTTMTHIRNDQQQPTNGN